MTRRRRKRRRLESVELNLAAMLDMAFQLLMFFILTFSPAPIESQIAMLLPAVHPIARPLPQDDIGPIGISGPLPPDARPLTVTVLSNPTGAMTDMAVDQQIVRDLSELNSQLSVAIDKLGGLCPQLVMQVDGRLNYQQLMQVIEICTQGPNGLRDGVQRVTFIELRDQKTR